MQPYFRTLMVLYLHMLNSVTITPGTAAQFVTVRNRSKKTAGAGVVIKSRTVHVLSYMR